mgnify:FL=1
MSEKKYTITLDINKTITRLVGNQYGKAISEKQILPHADEEKIQLVFPETINNVAISFVEGMILGLSSKMSREEFYNRIDIVGNEQVVRKIEDVVKARI